MSTVSVTYTHGADLDMLAVSLGSIMSSELLICRKIDTFVPGPRETGLHTMPRVPPSVPCSDYRWRRPGTPGEGLLEYRAHPRDPASARAGTRVMV